MVNVMTVHCGTNAGQQQLYGGGHRCEDAAAVTLAAQALHTKFGPSHERNSRFAQGPLVATAQRGRK